jgi:single-stranded-DNA-specific exonuclease
MYDYDVIIIPDAGSSQYKKHKLLNEKGIQVIVLDHHESKKESDDAIVINNQLSPNYDN